MKKFKKFTGIVLAAMLLMTACSGEETGTKDKPELLDAVSAKDETAHVERTNVTAMTVNDGQIMADIEELSFDVEGYLYGLYVEAGELVEEGEVIATLVGQGYSEMISLEEEIASTEESNAAYFANLEVELELRKLSGEDTEEDEMLLRHEKEMAELRLDIKREKYERLKAEDIGYICLTAPRDCTVVAVTKVRNGGFLGEGSCVAAIAGDGELTVSCAYISEKSVANLVDCYALIHGNRYEITYIPYTKDQLTEYASYEITPDARFTLNEPDDSIVAGDYASVIFVTAQKENVLAVPINAIYSEAGVKYVYEISGSEHIRRNVSVGLSDAVYTEILDGIEEGAEIYVKNN